MCAFDADGNLYVAEATNHCVRRIDRPTGVITTVAGTGSTRLLGRWWPGHAGRPSTSRTRCSSTPMATCTLWTGSTHVIRKVDEQITEGGSPRWPVRDSKGLPAATADRLQPREPLREPNDCFLDGRGGWSSPMCRISASAASTLRTGRSPRLPARGRGPDGRRRAGKAASILGARAVCMDRQQHLICEREGNGVAGSMPGGYVDLRWDR